MEGLYKYIYNQHPKIVFDEIKYGFGTGVINQTFDQQGTRGILFHWIYWTPQNTGAQITFNDQYGIPIFSTIDNLALSNNAPMPLVRWGNILNVVCTLGTVPFNVCYQKMML